MSKGEGFLVLLGFALVMAVYSTLITVTLKALPSDWLPAIATFVFVIVALVAVYFATEDIEKMKKELGEKP